MLPIIINDIGIKADFIANELIFDKYRAIDESIHLSTLLYYTKYISMLSYMPL